MNVKPGDLASIIRTANWCRDCIGRIVKVIQLTGTDEWIIEFVEMEPSSIWFKRYTQKVEFLSISDAWLRPISGVPVNDEVTDDVKEPA